MAGLPPELGKVHRAAVVLAPHAGIVADRDAHPRVAILALAGEIADEGAALLLAKLQRVALARVGRVAVLVDRGDLVREARRAGEQRRGGTEYEFLRESSSSPPDIDCRQRAGTRFVSSDVPIGPKKTKR